MFIFALDRFGLNDNNYPPSWSNFLQYTSQNSSDLSFQSISNDCFLTNFQTDRYAEFTRLYLLLLARQGDQGQVGIAVTFPPFIHCLKILSVFESIGLR